MKDDEKVEEARDQFDDLEPTVGEFLELMQVQSLSWSEADRANDILDVCAEAAVSAASSTPSGSH